MSHISKNIIEIQQKISQLTKRDVRLVAVSKTKPVSDILEAYKNGLRHFGENYVQELVQKSNELPDDIRWHFIGHLQSNKVKKVLETKGLWIIETVDSEKIAREINKQLENNLKSQFNPTLKYPFNIFVQVNTSLESSKSGVEMDKCIDLVKIIRSECPHLLFKGLMTIGKLEGDPNEDFQRLVDMRSKISKEFDIKEDELELSMGMSGDYDIAISMGSTNVRIGSTIFGAREYKK